MNENKALEMLEQFAVKIGSTAEQAWPLYVGYVRTTAITASICSLIGMLLICSIIIILSRRMADQEKTEEEKRTCRSVGLLFAVIIAVIPIFFIAVNLPAFFCPEGYAISSFLKR